MMVRLLTMRASGQHGYEWREKVLRYFPTSSHALVVTRNGC